ncbi:MAG: SBBP repeat-containing protein [Chlorobi bacterium]|jgi:hypothetical protein|nr:SBBP repeat-containing protein [Chlorobiota bacterium]
MAARTVALLLVLTVASVGHTAPIAFQSGFVESDEALYIARIGHYRVYCRADGISIAGVRRLGDSVRVERFDLDFPAKPSAIEPAGQRPELYRFISGNTQRDRRSFDAVRYVSVAPGVDLLVQWTPHKLKYDVVAASVHALHAFRFALRGARVEGLRSSGALVIATDAERFLDDVPTAYQPLPDGTLRRVSVAYEVADRSSFGYRITSDYDPTLPVVIDPAIVWSTYVGGSQEDAAGDIATDPAGNIYIAGNSLSIDFPLRGTTTNRGRQNMVIAKFTPAGQHVWSTYFGGERDEVAKAIVCDGSSLYVGGWSSSPSVVLDQPQPNRAGGAFDAVLLVFTTDGTFVRGTFLGGSREELVNALALRRDGSIIAVGRTNSSDFPIAQAQQPTNAGDNDIFVTALSTQNLQILWSTYYGGSAFDEAYGVATSPSGSVFVTGVTVSTDFPTANAYQARPPALDNAFVLSLNSAGRRTWATYLGGNDYDLGNRIVYWNGKLFIAGTTSSDDFPILGDSIAQRTKSGYNDAFLACIGEAGTPIWTTFWGGRLAESGFSVLVLPNGNVVLAGSTSSPDFPRRRSILWSSRGNDDVFVALFRDGYNVWSATFGGSGDDILYAAALLPTGDIVGAGETRSRDFEPLVNAQYQASQSPANRSDCFLFRLCTLTPIVEASSPNRVICNGRSIELWARDSSDIATIRWNTGSTAKRIVATSPGDYWFVATSSNGCTVYSDTVRLLAASTEAVQLDTIAPRRSLRLCEGERLALVVRSRYRSVVWLDDRGGLLASGDTLWIESAATVRAVVEDTSGCIVESLPQTVTVAARPALAYRRWTSNGWIAPTSDTLTACTGDSITIAIERPSGAQCRWSDGSSACQRTISAPLQLSANVTDSNGCTWQMPTLTFRFDDRQRPVLSSTDTICVEVPFTVRTTGGSTSVRWNIAAGLMLIAATADSSELTLAASTSGTFSIRAWFDSPCSDTTTAEVTVVSPPTLRIASSAQRICPGEIATLSAPSGFVQYWWNSALHDSVFVVQDSGWYRLTVETAHGCIARDSIYIALAEPVTASEAVITFGTIEVGQTATLPLSISNPADTSALVRVTVQDGQAFSLDGSTQQQAVIEPRSVYATNVVFSPLAAGDFSDTISIEQQVPCRQTLRVVVRGTAILRDRPIPIEFDVGDVTVSPLDGAVRIPLYAWSSSLDAQRLDTLTIELSYNPTMLLPTAIEPGSFSGPVYGGGRGKIRATVPLDSIPSTPRTYPIAVLDAAVLLGNREEDSIAIESASASRALVPTLGAGIVRYTGLCTEGGVRLLGQHAANVLTIVPNPSSGSEPSVIIVAPENGRSLLCLFASDGRIVWTHEFDARAGAMYEFTLPSLPSGFYLVRFSTVSGLAKSERIVVVR